MQLAELQLRMQRVLLTGSADGKLLKLFADPPQQWEYRLSVYRNNICHSLLGVLQTAFPVTQQLVGEECFTATGLRFIAEHPPRHPALYRYGHKLPEFIAQLPPLAEALPWLADVARLEWMRNESLFAPRQKPLSPDQLAEIPGDQLPNTRFGLHPSVQLLKSSWAVHTIWAAHQPNGSPLESVNPEQAENILIWRQPDESIYQRCLTLGETALITAFALKLTFSEAAEMAALQDPQFDLGTTLATLLRDGALEPPIMDASTSGACG